MTLIHILNYAKMLFPWMEERKMKLIHNWTATALYPAEGKSWKEEEVMRSPGESETSLEDRKVVVGKRG